MRPVSSVVLSLVLSCAVPMAAHATPITWGPNTYDPADFLLTGSGTECLSAPASGSCNSIDYSHDLTTDGFIPGSSSTDLLTGGTLDLYLRDGDTDNGADSYKVALELGGLGAFTSGTLHGSLSFDFQTELDSVLLANLLWSIQEDGVLSVRLSQIGGPNSNLWFDRSVFTGVGTRDAAETLQEPPLPDVAAVPEPASLLLLGTGLAVAAARLRRTRR